MRNPIYNDGYKISHKYKDETIIKDDQQFFLQYPFQICNKTNLTKKNNISKVLKLYKYKISTN